MARIRTIKPDFFRDVKLFRAETETGLPLRLAYVALWTVADREGRFEWQPEQLKVDCFPLDGVDFSRVLDALATRGFLVKYACQTGQERVFLGLIRTFRKHQVVNNKERPSELPAPDAENCQVIDVASITDACPSRDERVNDATSTRDERVTQGKEGKGREQEGKGTAAALTRVSDLKPDAYIAALGELERKIAELCGNSPNLVNFGRVKSWLADGCTEDDILGGVRKCLAAKPPGWAPNNLNYFDGAVADAKAQRLAPMPPATTLAGRGASGIHGRSNRDVGPSKNMVVGSPEHRRWLDENGLSSLPSSESAA